MMHWRDIALTILGFFHLTDRPTEEELIEHGRELEREKQRKGYVHIYIDPTIRSYPQNDNPGPVTDKPRVIPNPRGSYFQEQRKSFEKTHLLPTFKRLQQDEPPITAEMTAVRIPTWIL